MTLWLEHRTLNQENTVSNLLAAVSKFEQFRSHHLAPVDSDINEYLAVGCGGHVNELPSRSNCGLAECFPQKTRWRWNEHICQGVK